MYHLYSTGREYFFHKTHAVSLHYTLIIVVPRIIDRRYTIDSSVRSTESRLSYPAEPTLSDTSINPTILKLSHQHDEPLERFCSWSSVEEKNACTILFKKKSKKPLSREAAAHSRINIVGHRQASRGDRISHELMELSGERTRGWSESALSTSVHLYQVEHHPDRAELSHASALSFCDLPSLSLSPFIRLHPCPFSLGSVPLSFSLSCPVLAHSFCRSLRYALKFAARGGAPFPFRSPPRPRPPAPM